MYIDNNMAFENFLRETRLARAVLIVVLEGQ